MIELPEAIALIERVAAPLPPRRTPLLEACGRVLAAPIVSDVDSPPWDRAMMDGFAVRSEDFSAGASEVVELDVAVDLAAGDVTTLEIARRRSVRPSPKVWRQTCSCCRAAFRPATSILCPKSSGSAVWRRSFTRCD